MTGFQTLHMPKYSKAKKETKGKNQFNTLPSRLVRDEMMDQLKQKIYNRQKTHTEEAGATNGGKDVPSSVFFAHQSLILFQSHRSVQRLSWVESQSLAKKIHTLTQATLTHIYCVKLPSIILIQFSIKICAKCNVILTSIFMKLLSPSFISCIS